jgi:hypothetical protein
MHAAGNKGTGPAVALAEPDAGIKTSLDDIDQGIIGIDLDGETRVLPGELCLNFARLPVVIRTSRIRVV